MIKIPDFLQEKIDMSRQKNQREKILNDFKKLHGIARQIIQSDDYVELKRDYEKTYKEAVHLLAVYNEEDPVKYKIGVREICIYIQLLQDLIDKVEVNAIEVEKEEEQE